MVGGGGRGGGGSTGRLYQASVDSKKALPVRMKVRALRDPGFVTATVTLATDQSLDDVRTTMMDAITAVATDPPTADEVARAKARILQGIEMRMANSQEAARARSETVAAGDWRLAFVHYDQITCATPADVVRVVKRYFQALEKHRGRISFEWAAALPTTLPKPDLVAQLQSRLENVKRNASTHQLVETMDAANEITRLVADLSAEFQTPVPYEAIMLRYYGQQLELGIASARPINADASEHRPSKHLEQA